MTEIIKEYIYKKGKPEKMVIFLHGYGENADNVNNIIAPFIESLDNCIVLIPNSPQKCELPKQKLQWYSMQDFDSSKLRRTSTDFNEVIKIYEKSSKSMKSGFAIIENYIKTKLKDFKIKPKNLYLCGFSQGASLSIYSGLMYKERIAGIISFSGIICPAEVLLGHFKNTPPVLLTHGKRDSIVRFEAQEYSKQYLEKMGSVVSLYAMDNTNHTLTEDALLVASGFINAKK